MERVWIFQMIARKIWKRSPQQRTFNISDENMLSSHFSQECLTFRSDHWQEHSMPPALSLVDDYTPRRVPNRSQKPKRKKQPNLWRLLPPPRFPRRMRRAQPADLMVLRTTTVQTTRQVQWIVVCHGKRREETLCYATSKIFCKGTLVGLLQLIFHTALLLGVVLCRLITIGESPR